jgi:hypothetical protein
MKCITTILLGTLLLALASSAAIEEHGETFTEAIDRMIESFDDLQSWSCFAQLETLDRECLDEKLNVKNNGEKIVNEITAAITILPAIALCVDSERDLLHAFIHFMIGYIYNDTDTCDCFKLELQKIEPNATILEAFDADNMKKSSDECEDVVDMKELDRLIKEIIGEIDEASCGTLTIDEVRKFMLKIRILRSGGFRKALARSEKSKLIDFLSVKVEKFVKCRAGKL